MRTVLFVLAVMFFACSVRAQTVEDRPSVQTATPLHGKGPARPGSVAQPARGDAGRRPYGIENYSPLAAAGGYRRQRETFWEFWWRRLNPRNINYGAWIERRRQVFLEQAGANRYFWFAFWEFACLCFLLLWAAKERMDRKDIEWEAAECLADLANYADYCLRHAIEAVTEHNNHIEACNRVIESAETGRMLVSGSGTEGEWKAELEKMRAEVAEKGAQVLRLTNELAQRSTTVTDLSAQIDELARSQAGKPEAHSNIDLVTRVSRLTDEVQALRQENSRLKREIHNADSGNRVR